MTKLNFSFIFSAVLLCAVMIFPSGCMKWDYDIEEDFKAPAEGLIIANEGNFQYSNATLSFYDPATDKVENEVFIRVNGFKLGDVAQSLTMHNGLVWIVVNHSHVIFAVDSDTFKEKGRIENLTSPRYIHFVNDRKAYVSQLWDNRIFIVDTQKYEITGYITVPGMTMESGSTEQMVQQGRYVYVNCWSYQNRILKIDSETDKIVAELTVGIQPKSITLDKYGRLWVATDGGYDGSPYGKEPAKLLRIDTGNFEIEKEWSLEPNRQIRDLRTNRDGSELFWICDDVWEMNVDSDMLPSIPLIPNRSMLYYSMTVSPIDGDIYVADAIDYQQSGMIYRYSSRGELKSSFSAGINPAAFAWKNGKE